MKPQLPSWKETRENPCLQCGACCCYFHVAFYWRESVPEEWTEDMDMFRRVMKGTTSKKPRCIALGGHPGKRVGCRIYDKRSSNCREFFPSFENGRRNKRCDEARMAFGFKPLEPRDWS